jgi:hypothetical protein
MTTTMTSYPSYSPYSLSRVSFFAGRGVTQRFVVDCHVSTRHVQTDESLPEYESYHKRRSHSMKIQSGDMTIWIKNRKGYDISVAVTSHESI